MSITPNRRGAKSVKNASPDDWDLSLARLLVKAGVPIVVGPLDQKGNPTGHEWDGWQDAVCDPSIVDTWEPGLAIAGVSGHGVDVLDHDPRNDPGGASIDRFNNDLGEDGPVTLGRNRTASGGTHYLIRSLGIPKAAGKGAPLPGLDYLGGTRDGDGRSLIFLPPTARPPKDADGNIGRRLVRYKVIEPFHLNGEAPSAATRSWIRKMVTERDRKRTSDNGGTADNESKGRRARLRSECIKAKSGERHDALRDYVWDYMRSHEDEDNDEVTDLFTPFLEQRRWTYRNGSARADIKEIVEDYRSRNAVTPEEAKLLRGIREEGIDLHRHRRHGRKNILGEVFSRADLKKIPKPEPLIEDWLYLRTTVMLAGATGTDKTFTLIGWGCSVATGQPWLGHDVTIRPVRGRKVSGYPVILVIGEGAGGLDGRIAAWEEDNGTVVPPEMLTVLRLPPSIMDEKFWKELTTLALTRGARFIAFDTFSSLAPGADETKDAAWVIRKMEELSVALDGTVVMSHHSGWSDKLRVRGGSQLEFNPDTVVIASKTSEDDDSAPVRLWLKKDKDGPTQGRKIYVSRRSVLGSCVLEIVDAPPSGSNGAGRPLSMDERRTTIGEWIQDNGPETETFLGNAVWAENEGTGKHKWTAAIRAMKADGDLVPGRAELTRMRQGNEYKREFDVLKLRRGWPRHGPSLTGAAGTGRSDEA